VLPGLDVETQATILAWTDDIVVAMDDAATLLSATLTVLDHIL